MDKNKVIMDLGCCKDWATEARWLLGTSMCILIPELRLFGRVVRPFWCRISRLEWMPILLTLSVQHAASRCPSSLMMFKGIYNSDQLSKNKKLPKYLTGLHTGIN